MPKGSDRPARKRLNATENGHWRQVPCADSSISMGAKLRRASNDRRYDEKVARTVKRMKPDRLDELIQDDEE